MVDVLSTDSLSSHGEYIPLKFVSFVQSLHFNWAARLEQMIDIAAQHGGTYTTWKPEDLEKCRHRIEKKRKAWWSRLPPPSKYNVVVTAPLIARYRAALVYLSTVVSVSELQLWYDDVTQFLTKAVESQ